MNTDVEIYSSNESTAKTKPFFFNNKDASWQNFSVFHRSYI